MGKTPAGLSRPISLNSDNAISNIFDVPRVGIFILLLALAGQPALFGRSDTAGGRILVNHVGFLPQTEKCCMVEGTTSEDYQVVDTKTGKIVFSGRFTSREGDLGVYSLGDFSSLTSPGTYEIRSPAGRSEEFRIARDVLDDPLRKTIGYFALQRCGPSATGYNAPCHVDDGRRRDTRKHQDVSGGWHDATDLRKWVDATLYGMTGLSKAAYLLGPDWGGCRIVEELRWGNRYFLKMQEPAGYVMNHIGDVFYHGDQNRWTDNVVGNWDDRLIQTNPTDPTAQYCFIMAQAALARLTAENDPAYSDSCREAGLKCLEWCIAKDLGRNPVELGAAAAACAELYRTLGEKRFRDLAAGFARRLLSLQERNEIGSQNPIRGFFHSSSADREPFRNIYKGCWHLIGLCELVELFPDHEDASLWREGIELYSRDYLILMSQLNHFGIVPYGLYFSDPGGNRRTGAYWYRWFMESDRPWWVGINANIASAGVGLLKASRILEDNRLAAVAQRQLDWILGVNPFDSSTLIGVGRNNPDHYEVSYWFNPGTPVIPGAVMNGIGGNGSDMPILMQGEWETCEYWTPMVCYTMWLLAELKTY